MDKWRCWNLYHCSTNSAPPTSGLGQSDRIALGVGLAFGLATVILPIIGIYLQGQKKGGTA
jgi:hypothetical protein